MGAESKLPCRSRQRLQALGSALSQLHACSGCFCSSILLPHVGAMGQKPPAPCGDQVLGCQPPLWAGSAWLVGAQQPPRRRTCISLNYCWEASRAQQQQGDGECFSELETPAPCQALVLTLNNQGRCWTG